MTTKQLDAIELMDNDIHALDQSQRDIERGKQTMTHIEQQLAQQNESLEGIYRTTEQMRDTSGSLGQKLRSILAESKKMIYWIVGGVIVVVGIIVIVALCM